MAVGLYRSQVFHASKTGQAITRRAHRKIPQTSGVDFTCMTEITTRLIKSMCDDVIFSNSHQIGGNPELSRESTNADR